RFEPAGAVVEADRACKALRSAPARKRAAAAVVDLCPRRLEHQPAGDVAPFGAGNLALALPGAHEPLEKRGFAGAGHGRGGYGQEEQGGESCAGETGSEMHWPVSGLVGFTPTWGQTLS